MSTFPFLVTTMAVLLTVLCVLLLSLTDDSAPPTTHDPLPTTDHNQQEQP
jgi:hypothetical protein